MPFRNANQWQLDDKLCSTTDCLGGLVAHNCNDFLLQQGKIIGALHELKLIFLDLLQTESNALFTEFSGKGSGFPGQLASISQPLDFLQTSTHMPNFGAKSDAVSKATLASQRSRNGSDGAHPLLFPFSLFTFAATNLPKCGKKQWNLHWLC